MTDIEGNLIAVVQKKTTEKNVIGEQEETWTFIDTVLGWLDYSPAVDASTIIPNKAKVQDTTHIYLCDYNNWIKSVTSEDSRLIIKGNIYNILIIDDPMEMHEHLEIYLKYVGGGLGCQ